MTASAPYPQPFPPTPVLPSMLKTGMATTSLVLGILGLLFLGVCVPIGLLAIIFGIIGWASASSRPEEYGGKGMAIAGVLLGVFHFILPFILVFGFQSTWINVWNMLMGEMAKENLATVHASLASFASQNNGSYPPDLQTLVNRQILAGEDVALPKDFKFTQSCGFYYVSALTATDPADWIVAYTPPLGMPPLVIVLLQDGTILELPEDEFTVRLTSFQAAYREREGADPTIQPPK